MRVVGEARATRTRSRSAVLRGPGATRLRSLVRNGGRAGAIQTRSRSAVLRGPSATRLRSLLRDGGEIGSDPDAKPVRGTPRAERHAAAVAPAGWWGDRERSRREAGPRYSAGRAPRGCGRSTLMLARVRRPGSGTDANEGPAGQQDGGPEAPTPHDTQVVDAPARSAASARWIDKKTNQQRIQSRPKSPKRE